jgi:hypothetical protein
VVVHLRLKKTHEQPTPSPMENWASMLPAMITKMQLSLV